MKMHGHALPIAVLAALLSLAASCGGSSGSGDSRGGVPNYTPTTANDDWQVATPAGQDADGYYFGSGATMFTARDMARFGQLYLDAGAYGAMQLVPAEWVQDSFE